MKKISLLIVSALMALTSVASTTVTWNVAESGLADMSRPSEPVVLAEGYKATFGGSYVPIYSTYYGGMQFYAGSTLTIEGVAIEKVVLNYVTGYPGEVVASTGTLVDNSTNYTWTTAEAVKSVVFTNNVQGFRLTGIELTYDETASTDNPGDDPGDFTGVPVTVEWVAAEQGYEDKTSLGIETIAEGYTISFAVGGNTANPPLEPKYYDNGSAARVYANNTFTVAGQHIVEVVITCTSGNVGEVTASKGTVELDSETQTWTWTGMADEIVFTNVARGQMRITKMAVTYLSPAETEAAAPAAPVINSYAYSGVHNLVVTIPDVDVNGNKLNTENLYFQVLKDIEHETTPLVIAEVGDPDLYEALTEDLVLIPYSYDDYYVETDEASRTIWLDNNNFDSYLWNQVGVQSIYRDGEVELESEISWYFIRDYSVVSGIDGVSTPQHAEPVFTLDGRRVDSLSGQKGVFIIGNKKMIVK